MKKLFIIILVTVSLMFGCAGMQPATETKIERVVQMQGYEKDYIYDSVRMWIAENFKSAKKVIEYEDKDTDTIIGNGNIRYLCQGIDCMAVDAKWRVFFTMRVDVKNEKIRLTFMNLKYDSGQFKTGPVSLTKNALIAHKPILLAFGDEIKLYIEQNSKKKDW